MSEKIRALPVEEKLEQLPIPPAAARQLREMAVQIAQAQASMRLYLNGVLIGLGVDTEANNVNVEPDFGAYTVEPVKR